MSANSSKRSTKKFSIRTRYVLVILVLAGFLIKIVPSLSYDFLVNYDSIYHTRIGQTVAETGWVPATDYVAGGRPHLYPFGYHLVLGYLSIMTGASVFDLIQFMLPLVSALLVLPTFFLINRFRDEKTALWGAAFMALSPMIASQSYDSPHLFGLLLFPFLVYALLKGKYIQGGLVIAVSLLFNYGIVLTMLSVVAVFAIWKLARGERKYLLYSVLILSIGIGLVSPWLVMAASTMGECFDASTAVASINAPGEPYLWQMMPFIMIIGIGLLYLTRRLRDDYALFWRIAFGVGTIGFLISLFMPQLHPYDQILLFGFSMPFLLAELKWRKEYKFAILAIMLVGMFFSVIAVKPALNESDVDAVKWLTENVQSGDVLANLEISSAINMMAMKEDIKTEFDQFLECIPDRQRWVVMDEVLRTSDSMAAKSALERYGVSYIMVTERDYSHYGFNIQKFAEMGFDEVFVSGKTRVYKTGYGT